MFTIKSSFFVKIKKTLGSHTKDMRNMFMNLYVQIMNLLQLLETFNLTLNRKNIILIKICQRPNFMQKLEKKEVMRLKKHLKMKKKKRNLRNLKKNNLKVLKKNKKLRKKKKLRNKNKVLRVVSK